jgi:hypothetical protein
VEVSSNATGALNYTSGSFMVGGQLILSSATLNVTPSMTLGVDGPQTLHLAGAAVNAPSLRFPAGTTPLLFGSTINAPVLNETTLLVQGAANVITGVLTTTATSLLRLNGTGGLAKLTLSHDFTNNGTIEYTGNGFGAELVLNAGGGRLINGSGATLRTTGFPFYHVTGAMENRGTVDLSVPLNVTGQLIVPAGAGATFTGNGSAISVSGLDVDGATFDNVPLVSSLGTISRFDNATFQNMNPAATQFTVVHPGGSSPFVFTGVSFLTTPTTGLFVSAQDQGGPNTLIIEFVGSNPGDGSVYTATAGGAVVIW